jgi:hypothetical protein
MAGGVNPIGNLQGKVNANNALVVTLDGGAATAELVTVTKDAIGVTSTDGLVIQNTTDAAAGAQQYSPRLRLHGEGWKTDATAASQTIDFVLEVQPVQGTSAPSGNLILKASINGGAFSTVGTFTSGGQLLTSDGSASAPPLAFTGAPTSGWYRNSGGGVALTITGTARLGIGTNFRMAPDMAFMWSSTADPSATEDLSLSRLAAGSARFGSASNANTYDITLADWGTTLSAEAVPLANDASVLIGAATSGTVHISYPGDAAIFVARGTANATRLADGSATFTVTKDNAATVNFYYDTNGYYLQNKTGGSLSFRVMLVGG